MNEDDSCEVERDDDGDVGSTSALEADGDESMEEANQIQEAYHGEHCIFDLFNLSTFNTHQVNSAVLYTAAHVPENHYDRATIESNPYALAIKEAFLIAKASEATTQILKELWKLPVEKTDVGPLARLPRGESGESKIPRALVRFSSLFSVFIMHFIAGVRRGHC